MMRLLFISFVFVLSHSLIHAQRSQVGSEIPVSLETLLYFGQPSAASNSKGETVVAWSSRAHDTILYLQMFDKNGIRIGPEVHIDNTVHPTGPTNISIDEAGNYVVTWSTINQSSLLYEVVAKAFSKQGNPLSNHISIATATTQFFQPAITLLNNNNFLIAYRQTDTDDTKHYYTQKFSLDGSVLNTKTEYIETQTYIPEQDMLVASDTSGNYALAWQSSVGGTYPMTSTVKVLFYDKNDQEHYSTLLTYGNNPLPSSTKIAMNSYGKLAVAHRIDNPSSSSTYLNVLDALANHQYGYAQTDRNPNNPVFSVSINDNNYVALCWNTPIVTQNDFYSNHLYTMLFDNSLMAISQPISVGLTDGVKDEHQAFALPNNKFGLAYANDSSGYSSVNLELFGQSNSPRATLTDVSADFLNGSILKVEWTKAPDESIVQEYKIVFAPSFSNDTDLTMSDLRKINSSNYIIVPKTGAANYSILLDTGSLDYKGNKIQFNSRYKVYVLDSASLPYTSGMTKTESVALPDYNVLPVQNVFAEDISNRGDASDLRIRFNVVQENTFTKEYRLFVIPSDSATILNTDLSKLGTGNYFTESKGEMLHTVDLLSTTKDVFGNLIVENRDYIIAVMNYVGIPMFNQTSTTNYPYVRLSNQVALWGNEFQVNQSYIGNQNNPRVAVNAHGDYVIVWKDQNKGNLGRLYDSLDHPITDEFSLYDDTYGFIDISDVAINNHRQFVVSHGDYAPYIQAYDSLGTKAGIPVKFNANVFKQDQNIILNDDGIYTVVYFNDAFESRTSSYSFSGTPIRNDINLNAADGHRRLDPSISMGMNGDYVITWKHYSPGGDTFIGLECRMYDKSGNPKTNIISISTEPLFDPYKTSISINSNGTFIVSWVDARPSSPTIFTQIISSAGLITTGKMSYSLVANEMLNNKDVILLDDNTYWVNWETVDNTNHNFIRRFSATHQPLTDVISLSNVSTFPDYANTSVSSNHNNKLVYTWVCPTRDGDQSGVFAKNILLNAAQNITAMPDNANNLVVTYVNNNSSVDYKTLLVPKAQASDFDLAAAEAAILNQNMRITDLVSLPLSNSKDSQGNLLVEGNSYVVFLLGITNDITNDLLIRGPEFKYQLVASVTDKQKGGLLNIYPNPATDFCLVNLESLATGHYIIKIYDNAFRLHITQYFAKENSSGQLIIPLQQLSTGTYMIRIEGAEKIYTAKLIKF